MRPGWRRHRGSPSYSWWWRARCWAMRWETRSSRLLRGELLQQGGVELVAADEAAHLMLESVLAQPRRDRGGHLVGHELVGGTVGHGEPHGAEPMARRGEVQVRRQFPAPQHDVVDRRLPEAGPATDGDAALREPQRRHAEHVPRLPCSHRDAEIIHFIHEYFAL